jgi:hypothetical protein
LRRARREQLTMKPITLASVRLDARAILDPRAEVTLTAHNGAPVYAITTESDALRYRIAFRLSTGVDCYCYAPTLEALSTCIRGALS